MKNKSKIKNLFYNLVLALAVILFTLIFLEIIIRIFFTQNLNYTMFDSTLMYKHIPNFETKYQRQEFSQIVKFNSKGLRDYEYSYEKPQGVYRILLLGSSFSQALQVNLNGTYENLLEKRLNSEGRRKYEIINSAVGGHGTAQEMIYLKTEGLKYNPDMILLDFSMRDIKENSISPLVSVDNGKLVEHIPVKASLPKKMLLFCSRYSHLCSLAQTAILDSIKKIGNNEGADKGIDTADMYKKESTPQFNEELEKTFLMIKEIKKTADANKIPLVIIVIPHREQVDRGKYLEFIKNNNLNEGGLDQSKIQKLALKFASENKIPAFDMQPYFQQKNKNNTFYFNIDGHWNPKGHQLAADLIYDSLVNNNIISTK